VVATRNPAVAAHAVWVVILFALTCLAGIVVAAGLRAQSSGGRVLEVYPGCTLRRLADSDKRFAGAGKGKFTADERSTALHAFADLIDFDPEDPRLISEHAFDAAYTGWLAPDNLEQPPKDFNIAAGWIWFPRAVHGQEPPGAT
jgi:hypothetical protein